LTFFSGAAVDPCARVPAFAEGAAAVGSQSETEIARQTARQVQAVQFGPESFTPRVDTFSSEKDDYELKLMALVKKNS